MSNILQKFSIKVPVIWTVSFLSFATPLNSLSVEPSLFSSSSDLFLGKTGIVASPTNTKVNQFLKLLPLNLLNESSFSVSFSWLKNSSEVAGITDIYPTSLSSSQDSILYKTTTTQYFANDISYSSQSTVNIDFTRISFEQSIILPLPQEFSFLELRGNPFLLQNILQADRKIVNLQVNHQKNIQDIEKTSSIITQESAQLAQREDIKNKETNEIWLDSTEGGGVEEQNDVSVSQNLDVLPSNPEFEVIPRNDELYAPNDDNPSSPENQETPESLKNVDWTPYILFSLGITAEKYPYIINPTDNLTFEPDLFRPSADEDYSTFDLRFAENNPIINHFTYSHFPKENQFYWTLPGNQVVLETKGDHLGLFHEGRSNENNFHELVFSEQKFLGLQTIFALPNRNDKRVFIK